MRLVDAIKMLEAFKTIAGENAEVLVDVFQLEARVSDQVFDFVRNREREERPLEFRITAQLMSTRPMPEYAPGPSQSAGCDGPYVGIPLRTDKFR